MKTKKTQNPPKDISKKQLLTRDYSLLLNHAQAGRLKPEDLHTVEKYAHNGMTKDDIAMYFGLPDYTALTAYEAEWFDIAFSRGLVTGKLYVMQQLMAAMNGKEATEACNAYLDRFMDGWKQTDEVVEKQATVSFHANIATPIATEQGKTSQQDT